MQQMKRVVLVVTLMALMFGAVPLVALPVTYNGNLTGWNDGHHYVGNVSLTVGQDTVVAWCVDSLNTISRGQTWDANVLSLASLSGLDGLLPGVDANELRAAFLLGYLNFNVDQVTAVRAQHAIWNFGNPGGYPLSADELALQNGALAAVSNRDFRYAYLVMPTSGSGQAHQFGTADQVPEPATMALFGGGLIAFGLFGRRVQARRRQQNE